MINELFNIWHETPPDKKIVVITGENFAMNLNEQEKTYRKNKIEQEILNINILNYFSEKTWDWTNQKRALLNIIKPKSSYYALAKLENNFKNNFTLITSNIDGIHAKAGNYRLIEINGNIHKNKKVILSNEKKINFNYLLIDNQGNYLKPDIVFKGEMPERKKILQATILAQQADILLIIGNDLKNPIIAELPITAKKLNHTKIIEINFTQNFAHSDIYLKASADEILSMLINIMIDLENGIRKSAINSS